MLCDQVLFSCLEKYGSLGHVVTLTTTYVKISSKLKCLGCLGKDCMSIVHFAFLPKMPNQ